MLTQGRLEQDPKVMGAMEHCSMLVAKGSSIMMCRDEDSGRTDASQPDERGQGCLFKLYALRESSSIREQ
jgi:hypothetical protein